MRNLVARSVIMGAALAALSACGAKTTTLAARGLSDSARTDSTARARQDSINRTLPGYVIDSLLPPEEELRRFRAAYPGDSATKLAGGSATREELVKRFVRAVVARDTNDLRAMAVHAREFGDLYYPESPLAHPPFHESPQLAWMMIQNPSSAGLTKLLKRLGGQPMTYVSHRCDPKIQHEGRNTRYAGCLIRVIGAKGDTTTKRLFGSIVARGGQYKFLSYTNDF